MDLVNLFDEMVNGTTDGAFIPELDMPLTEDNFLNMLADDENVEDFGLSMLENNQDLIDIMAPLMAAPFSPVSYDDIGVMGTDFCGGEVPITNVDVTDHPAQESTSPLRQLLLSKSTKRGPNKGSQLPKATPPVRKRSERAKQPKHQYSRKQREYTYRDTPATQSQGQPTQLARPAQYEQIASCDVVNEPKEKLVSKALKFPPCSVCGGKASGLHYGVNSCEACKGFFRRYIIRNEEYKCPKGGNCKVVNKNRENCSGCRLRKCLDLGMSKGNSKLGRYSLSRRTETIKKVNVLEGKEKGKHTKGGNSSPDIQLEYFRFDHTYSGIISGKQSPTLDDIVTDECSPDGLIEDLVCAMETIQPYGPSITTSEQIQATMKRHHQRYRTKLEMYGEMKAVPNKEYYKLLKEYGIDIDGRIKVFKEYVFKMKRMSERYYNFAMHIPGFHKLTSRDQSQLLNSSRCDFFVTLMHEGYSEEYKVLLARNGVAYHVDELSDKFFSRNLITSLAQGYLRIQKLNLTKEEKAMMVALTLVFTDRCKLENRECVDKMQYLISELLRYQLDRTSGPAASRRFASFVEVLVYLRDLSEIYWNEYRQLCKDEVIVEQVPMVTEFLVDDW